jgi:hypothetical protein
MIRAHEPADQEQVERCIIALQDFERSLEDDRVEGATITEKGQKAPCFQAGDEWP